MNEVALAALFTALGGVGIAVVNLLGARLNRQVVALQPPPLDEVTRLRSGIRRHIIRCPDPGELADL